MLGCTGTSCWRLPSNYLHGMSLIVVVSLEFLVVELILYAELLVVAGLHVETLETLLDSSWNEVFEESLLGSSLSFSLEIILFTELLCLSG